MRKIVLIFFAAIAVVSCGKEDKVDLNPLQEYKLILDAYRNPGDPTTDKFVYSFDADSMTVFGPRYENVDNVRIPVDTAMEKWPYFIVGNTIYFAPLNDDGNLIVVPESISPVQYRTLQWEILMLDESQMKVDIIANSTLVGHAEFRVEK